MSGRKDKKFKPTLPLKELVEQSEPRAKLTPLIKLDPPDETVHNRPWEIEQKTERERHEGKPAGKYGEGGMDHLTVPTNTRVKRKSKKARVRVPTHADRVNSILQEYDEELAQRQLARGKRPQRQEEEEEEEEEEEDDDDDDEEEEEEREKESTLQNPDLGARANGLRRINFPKSRLPHPDDSGSGGWKGAGSGSQLSAIVNSGRPKTPFRGPDFQSGGGEGRSDDPFMGAQRPGSG